MQPSAAQAWTKTTELFESWRGWATTGEEWVGSNRQFGQKLEDRGLRFQKRHGERGYWGLRLNDSAGEGPNKAGAAETRYVVRILKETDRGGLQVEYAWGEEGWLPKAMIKIGREREDGRREGQQGGH